MSEPKTNRSEYDKNRSRQSLVKGCPYCKAKEGKPCTFIGTRGEGGNYAPEYCHDERFSG